MKTEKPVKKGGAQPGNSNAKKDKENRKSKQYTLYFTEEKYEKLRQKAKERELSLTALLHLRIDNKRLPKIKSNKLIDIL